MISAITGRLASVNERVASLQVGAMLYELLVPSFDQQQLTERIGSEITFHTILYLEGDAARGNLEPRLIGFSSARDKAFFEKFTTVKGIGTKTALRALSVPAAQIAAAIESRNARFLTGLDGIGKRTAELIIAELAGKVVSFAVGVAIDASAPRAASQYTPAELDAITALTSLGERRPDAERLLQSARDANPALKTTDALLREMLRLRSL
jgi:Holliday junction DNA helicase RuvA